MRKIALFIVFFTFINTASGQLQQVLENKFPKAKSALPFIEHFPALARLLAADDPWELPPDKLVALLFPFNVSLAQGSESYPLLYTGVRTSSWPGLPVWNQFAYETEYYVFDPARPAIRFHIGRPLDVRMQTLGHTQPENLKALYPLLPDSARNQMFSWIRNVINVLRPYGAHALDFKHPRIHEYLLPGNTKLVVSDFTGTGVGSVYMQIDLQPASPVKPLMNKRIPAFPGAEGYGAYAVGGRGGKVYIVTTLKDYLSHERDGRPEGTLGEHEEDQPPPVLPAYPAMPSESVIHGSLREALEAHGPRTILFAVSGTIELKDNLEINDPYVTVAGNTAPGEGIQIRNWGIIVHTHDVILRYLRFRVGDIKGPGKNPRVLGDQTHAIDISGANIIIDHCEFAYANDQLVNIYGFKPEERVAVSFQWNYVYGGLSRSTHEKGVHSMSYFLCGWGYASFHHNLTAHTMKRNPRVWGLWMDYRNNTLYDYIGTGYGEEPDDYVKLNYIANTQKRGIYTYAYSANGICGQYYAEGNANPSGKEPFLKVPAETIMNAPFEASPVTTLTAAEAYNDILRWGGATLPVRDSITRFITESTCNGTGRIPGTTEDWPLGGYPVYGSAVPLADSDHDGMPDEWEIRYGLNPNDPSDAAKDKDGDGYTNLEEYINGTNPNEYIDYHNPKNNKDLRCTDRLY
jgi:pectate lyase